MVGGKFPGSGGGGKPIMIGAPAVEYPPGLLPGNGTGIKLPPIMGYPPPDNVLSCEWWVGGYDGIGCCCGGGGGGG
jgi:hypothetical protein